jgi:hypothetical protein
LPDKGVWEARAVSSVGRREAQAMVQGSGGDRRERLVALLAAGVAAVLLVSSVTWFASDQVVVGVAQLFLGAVLAGVAGLLYRRSQRR